MVEYWVKKMNDKNSIFQYSIIPIFQSFSLVVKFVYLMYSIIWPIFL